MISPESKDKIDKLSKDELQYEINLKNRSRFQADKYAYLQTRLSSLEDDEQATQRTEDLAHRRQELKLGKLSTWVAVATSVLSLLVGGGWYQEYQKNQRAQVEANERLVVEYLQPIATLLGDNESIFIELRSPLYAEPGWGILESYLIKIQRDGVPKNALMKKRIDTLVQNNEVILTLLGKYAAYAKTEDFKTELPKFRDHAIRYGDRWKSLLEVYAAKGNFPTAAPVFPESFPKAVQGELALRRHAQP